MKVLFKKIFGFCINNLPLMFESKTLCTGFLLSIYCQRELLLFQPKAGQIDFVSNVYPMAVIERELIRSAVEESF